MQYENFNLKKSKKTFMVKKSLRTNPQNEKFNYPRIFKKPTVSQKLIIMC